MLATIARGVGSLRDCQQYRFSNKLSTGRQQVGKAIVVIFVKSQVVKSQLPTKNYGKLYLEPSFLPTSLYRIHTND
ncbi:MAG: hypothetical protein JWP44_4942 [Mucilaginibacter sp.]|jgi:hypothetical protein|nr:hypothetical protein [Mucilaginibacter sp.]